MARAIGLDFGSQHLRMAVLEAGVPRALGAPLPIWQALGLSASPGADLPVVASLASDDELILDGLHTTWPALCGLALLYVHQSAGHQLQEDVDGLAVCLGGGSGSLVRHRLREISLESGFQSVRLLKPAQAASASQPPPSREQCILIVLLGASGLEVAACRRAKGRYEELAAESLPGISGTLFTRRLADHLAVRLDAPDELRLWDAAERAKQQLSSQEQADVLGLAVARTDYEKLIAPDLERVLAACGQVLHRAGLGEADLSGIWLAGNATRTPALGSLLMSLNRNLVHLDEFALAFGACRLAGELERTASTHPLPAHAASGEDSQNRVDTLVSRQNFEAALDILQQSAREIDRQRAQVYHAWGTRLLENNDLTGAYLKMRRALELHPDHAPYKQACEQAALRVARQQAGEIFQRAEDMYRRGDLAQAYSLYRQAYEKAPEDPQIRTTYATLLYRRSVEIVKRAVHQSRRNNLVSGDLKKARQMLREALELVPSFQEARTLFTELESYFQKA